jgi:hydrogenase maturation protease
MNTGPIRCLILACGNTLRGDDGAGPWLAAWAEQRFRDVAGVRVVVRQQWTPDLAEDIARAASVLFVDCSIASAPGAVQLVAVEPAPGADGLATHHLGAPELLALSSELYHAAPSEALLLAIGAGSTELGEAFSSAVSAALPAACRIVEETVLRLIGAPQLPA